LFDAASPPQSADSSIQIMQGTTVVGGGVAGLPFDPAQPQ
jgi:hypothetical protein